MDVDRALPDAVPASPDVLQEVPPGQDPPGILHEVGHQPELDGRQVEFADTHGDLVAQLVEPDGTDFEDVLA